ncbi:uncharacterized protein CBL_08300 [Carabus blaptoides fortunei]
MYKPRVSLKSILQGQLTLITNQINAYSNVPKNIRVNKCLVVSKLSRYEFERNRQRHLNGKELEAMLQKRGSDYEKMMHYHNLHKMFEGRFIDTLKDMGVEVRVVNRYTYTEDSIEWADVIFPTGGDGTFLLAASKIHDNKKPVIGFNSDPHRSEGHLCLPKHYSNYIREAIERLQNGQFDWLLRSRIRTTLVSHKGDQSVKNLHEHDDYEVQRQVAQSFMKKDGKVLPVLALNEVFMGEYLSARVSHLEMTLNSATQTTNMKCSGLCVCTGTGSTSWNLSINRLPTQSVAELLRLLDIDSKGETEGLAKHIADVYNRNLLFPADDRRLGYTIRDLISVGVWPQPKGIQPRGFASKLTIKSCCYDAGLVIDGGLSFSFNDGTIAMLEVYPEDALRTVVFRD